MKLSKKQMIKIREIIFKNAGQLNVLINNHSEKLPFNKTTVSETSFVHHILGCYFQSMASEIERELNKN